MCDVEFSSPNAPPPLHAAKRSVSEVWKTDQLQTELEGLSEDDSSLLDADATRAIPSMRTKRACLRSFVRVKTISGAVVKIESDGSALKKLHARAMLTATL